jgi:hypothetical protein
MASNKTLDMNIERKAPTLPHDQALIFLDSSKKQCSVIMMLVRSPHIEPVEWRSGSSSCLPRSWPESTGSILISAIQLALSHEGSQ